VNIFVLDPCPFTAAEQHCDKHVVKMILEYGQMLSTAHRLWDAKEVTAVDEAGRRKPKKFWLFEGEQPYLNADLDEDGMWVYKWIVLNTKMYQVAHAMHPCSKWVRETDANYHWMFMLFDGLLTEYTHRYGKVHSAAALKPLLRYAPMQIPRGQQTPFVQAMPEEYKNEDVVEAYHRFYVGSKARFARWTNRDLPKWFQRAMGGQDVSFFRRTRTVD
jgi:hypothetical protein